jgi:hypothetical protein
MWPKTWRVLKVVGRGLLMTLEVVLLMVQMGIKVIVVLVCALVLVMTFLAHFVGGPRG